MADYNDFKEKTIYEMERELKENARSQKKYIIRAIVVFLLIWFILSPQTYLYWFRFGTPHFPKYTTDEIIDVSKDPVQINITENKGKYFRYKMLENRKVCAIEKMAKYSISGKLVAKNYFFWSNYLPLIRDIPFHSIALIDVGLVWREMANDDVGDCMKYISLNVFDARRQLIPIFKRSRKCYAVYSKYGGRLSENKFSHTHVIPANASIMHAIMFAPKNKPIKMDGYLVDVYLDGEVQAKTSLSRNDTNKSARGGGACEVMYVERVQVGKKVYE